MKLIDKDALVAEIERRKHKLLDNIIFERDKEWVVRTAHQLNRIILFIDTLEVKEVDLEEALSDLDKDIKEFVTTEEFENESTTAGHYWVIAKHAFLLGLKAQKGEEV